MAFAFGGKCGNPGNGGWTGLVGEAAEAALRAASQVIASPPKRKPDWPKKFRRVA